MSAPPSQPTRRALTLGAILFAVFFYGSAIGMLGGALWSAYWSHAAASWPTVRGKIVNPRIESSRGDRGQARRGGSSTTYSVKVGYSYVVDGRLYTGNRIAFGYLASSEYKTHAEIFQKLKGRETVDVRYNPAAPSQSCLSCGFHQSIQFLAAYGATWLSFLGGLTALTWVGTRRDRVLLNNLVTYRLRTESDGPQAPE